MIRCADCEHSFQKADDNGGTLSRFCLCRDVVGVDYAGDTHRPIFCAVARSPFVYKRAPRGICGPEAKFFLLRRPGKGVDVTDLREAQKE